MVKLPVAKKPQITRQMTVMHRLCPALLLATSVSGQAAAIGLEEIALHSRMGQPLRALIAIHGATDQLESDCFTLAAAAPDELPTVTSGEIRLLRIGKEVRLLISRDQPITEPAFQIKLHVGCGIDQLRRYVLLPGAPVSAAPSVSNESSKAAGGRIEPAIHSRQAPHPLSKALAPETRLTTPPRHQPGGPTSTSAPAATPVPGTLAALAQGRDRIILGPAVESTQPSGNAQLASLQAIETQVLKLETTLHQLNTEVDKLDAALALGKESHSLHEEWRDRDPRQAPSVMLSGAQATPSASAAPAPANYRQWVDLLIGVLLGGSVSAGVAHWVNRRRERRPGFARRAPPLRDHSPETP